MDNSKGRYWDKPWGLVSSCTRCSEGCRNCWALSLEKRFHRGEEGKVVVHSEKLGIPLRTRKPTVFSVWNDLFHEDVPDEFIDAVFGVMALCPEHTFLVLTKRADRMAKYMNYPVGENDVIKTWPFPNLYLGLTVCNQAEADVKIPQLLKVPGKKWLSIEPMLGEIDLDRSVPELGPHNDNECWHYDAPWLEYIDAVILGGESGPGARPCRDEWVINVRDQCQDAGVPFFFKQWGTWAKPMRFGRFLDGREWNELPWRQE